MYAGLWPGRDGYRYSQMDCYSQSRGSILRPSQGYACQQYPILTQYFPYSACRLVRMILNTSIRSTRPRLADYFSDHLCTSQTPLDTAGYVSLAQEECFATIGLTWRTKLTIKATINATLITRGPIMLSKSLPLLSMIMDLRILSIP